MEFPEILTLAKCEWESDKSIEFICFHLSTSLFRLSIFSSHTDCNSILSIINISSSLFIFINSCDLFALFLSKLLFDLKLVLIFLK